MSANNDTHAQMTCPTCHGSGRLQDNPLLSLRRQHELSIRKACLLLGISSSHLHDMEHGRRSCDGWVEKARMEYPKA